MSEKQEEIRRENLIQKYHEVCAELMEIGINPEDLVND